MALLLSITNWNIDPWTRAMKGLAPDLNLQVWPDQADRPQDVRYALVWKPPAEVLASLPNLEAIFSLGAGVDHILRQPGLRRDVPIVRVVVPDMTMRMTEYVCLQVLMHHRRQRMFDEQQKRREWKQHDQWAASAVRVGVLGLGVLGRDAAEKLRLLGFQVAGWSRSPKDIPGIECFSGSDGLNRFLARTDILVCLLPHTPDTDGLIDRAFLRKLAKDGPLGGPVLINAGRGKLQKEKDILAALDAGELLETTLDVFEDEPLAPDSPMWSHPRVTVTPHIAADSDAATISKYILDQIRRHKAGLPLENVVDWERGY